jgi:hypothetical protein
MLMDILCLIFLQGPCRILDSLVPAVMQLMTQDFGNTQHIFFDSMKLWEDIDEILQLSDPSQPSCRLQKLMLWGNVSFYGPLESKPVKMDIALKQAVSSMKFCILEYSLQRDVELYRVTEAGYSADSQVQIGANSFDLLFCLHPTNKDSVCYVGLSNLKADREYATIAAWLDSKGGWTNCYLKNGWKTEAKFYTRHFKKYAWKTYTNEPTDRQKHKLCAK